MIPLILTLSFPGKRFPQSGPEALFFGFGVVCFKHLHWKDNGDYPKRLFAAITLLWEMAANNPKRPNVSEGAKGKLGET